MTRIQLLAALLAAGLSAGSATAKDFTIGYLQLKDDPRYAETRTYARFLLEPLGRPYPGARVALDEIKFHGAGAGVTFKLDRETEPDAAALLETVRSMHDKGVRFFVTDLPGDVLSELAAATRDMDIALFNASARDDALRGSGCAAHVFHVMPSHAMLMDALAQYLSFMKWRDVLVLQGPAEADAAIAAAFARSARKFGLEIVDNRLFVLSNDPRERSRNNIALLTGEGSYDVVFVADADGEFARSVPYQTVQPRPVVGVAGLGAAAWHWAWERYGAPQLESRFEAEAGRPMRDVDWAAWMAVKAVAEAVQRTGTDDFEPLIGYLRGPDLSLDAFKGNPASFRSWDNQLRQPVLLVTQNWVVERAPLEGFEHRTNDLDTLGLDEAETECPLAP